MNRFPTATGPDINEYPALGLLFEFLRSQYGGRVNAILLYGSCLRSGDIFDGLLDLYLICDDYRGAYPGRPLAVANWLLPPNVFYAEMVHEGKTLRSKYAVISTADFRAGCSSHRFESYIWGRFAQPVNIAWARDSDSLDTIEACLKEAVSTFLRRTLPRLPASGTLSGLWLNSLALSYNTELRSERSGRAEELAQASASHLAAVTQLVANSLDLRFSVYEQAQELYYRCEVSRLTRRLSAVSWMLRRGVGKLMSILRLLKALFTFTGGLDYIAWKLQRHSGQEIVIPPRVRRFPLLFIWGFCWHLYRRGVFR